jgi:hypothetical protein
MNYTTFTDPQMGTFTAEVPQGWQVRGGIEHPMPGDRRPWIEAVSPEGIYISLGSPAFPQSFCHFPGQVEGQFLQQGAGNAFLNLQPSAQTIGDFYLKHIAQQQFGRIQSQQRQQRTDLVEWMWSGIRQGAQMVSPSFQITADELILQITHSSQPMVASLLSIATCGEYMMGMWVFWDGNVYTYVAPPHLTALAEEIRHHLIASFQFTLQMTALYQQDEAIIAAGGQAAHAAQQNWFAGQQAAHNEQVASYDAMNSNYWDRQAANDAQYRGWEQNQAANDRISQNYSDATMDRQRLADDSVGKTYDVAAGYNYYWVDRETGNVVGTNTSEPPDYTNSYSQLRKLSG